MFAGYKNKIDSYINAFIATFKNDFASWDINWF